MRYPLTKQRENEGLLYVKTIVNNCGSIFRSINESDVGIDGYIEFVDSYKATGFVVGVQIKSGNSYIVRRKKEYLIKTDDDHLRYWSQSSIPIVGIVFDIERKVAGWVDLSQFAHDHFKPNKRNYSINFPWQSQFDENTFLNSFRSTLEQYRVRSKLLDILASISSIDPAKRLLGILALRQHRTNTISCFVFSSLLHDPDIDVRRLATIWFSTYLPHPDILYSAEFKPATGKLREYALFLAKYFNRGTIHSLLETIDEQGMERGSIGQCVWVILLEIPFYTEHLYSIARDLTIPDWLRFYSICTLGVCPSNAYVEIK